jgi:hypothetical protein
MPKGQRAESAVGSRVAVAAYDGHARLGEAQFGSDDMHDAALRAVQTVEGDALLGAVLFHLADLFCTQLIGKGHPTVRRAVCAGRDGMVNGGSGAFRAAHSQAALAQPRKSLRRGHFMHQM